jgi:DNA-directed RNA polymerase subunit RPC12/RpoP
MGACYACCGCGRCTKWTRELENRCAKCGEPYAEDDVICSRCGSRLPLPPGTKREDMIKLPRL